MQNKHVGLLTGLYKIEPNRFIKSENNLSLESCEIADLIPTGSLLSLHFSYKGLSGDYNMYPETFITKSQLDVVRMRC